MKSRLLFLCLFIPFLASAQESKWDIGQSILKDDVRIDDYRARVTKDGKTEIIVIRDGHMTMSEYFSPERDAERRRKEGID